MTRRSWERRRELAGRSIVDLTRGEEVPGWRQDIVCEFHGRHFPLRQRMLRTREFKLVVSPESVLELAGRSGSSDQPAETGPQAARRRILSPHSPRGFGSPDHPREAPDILEFRSP